MITTPFLIQLGLMSAAIIVVLIIGYMRPHEADTSEQQHQNWIIPPTLFRYAFWFGILASLIMAMVVTYRLYQAT